MKKIILKTLCLGLLATVALTQTACDSLLNQTSSSEVPASEFWKTEEDATYALMGAYQHVRGLFDRDYYFDGHGELLRVRSQGVLSTSPGNIVRGGAYSNGNYYPDPMWGYGQTFDAYYEMAYGGVNRTNYVIENVQKMIPNAATEESRKNLEAIVGEARLLRGMVYFRLITMWGDVPYFDKVVNDNSEVQYISRTPIAQVKDSILADFTYAFNTLPDKASEEGRAAKPAALAFRGKMKLYWASWKKNGWPELEGFQTNEAEAREYYASAAEDFSHVIDDYGLDLFRGGAPGQCGEPGDGETLPNYFYMFIPSTGNPGGAEGEFVFYFTHGGPGTGQGESLMRDFGGRSVGNSQNWVYPEYVLADRYQSTITGDYCEPLVQMNPNTNPDARTTPNSAVNPQSYANRDYRMKATILWDYEKIQAISSEGTEDGMAVFIYKKNGSTEEIDGVTYNTYRVDGEPTGGYVFRKFLRNYSGGKRDEGDMYWPVIRLADVFLMYAEADNEVNGPQPKAIELVNRVRYRAGLPALAGDKTADRDAFFAAIEQERAVELIGEGQRSFDLRRWRTIEKAFGVTGPGYAGYYCTDTYGGRKQQWYVNPTARDIQRAYIFAIPQSERDRNPNMSQNTPWL